MSVVVFLLVAIGLMSLMVGTLWLLVVVFRVSILWGIVVLFFPLTTLFFVLWH